MRPETSKAERPLSCTKQGNRSSICYIIVQGLTPLALLAIIGIVVLVLIMLIRFLLDPASFFLVQQLFFAVVMFAGLTLAIITYIVTTRRALRQIETCRQSGHTTEVTAGLVVLTLVAIIIALPVILGLFFH